MLIQRKLRTRFKFLRLILPYIPIYVRVSGGVHWKNFELLYLFSFITKIRCINNDRRILRNQRANATLRIRLPITARAFYSVRDIAGFHYPPFLSLPPRE